MDTRIIRINSNQTGPYVNNNNVVSVTLDQNQVVDMSRSYLEIVMHVDSTDGEPATGNGIYNFEMVYGADPSNPIYNASLIKNCRIISSTQGILEEINDVNVLNANINSFLTSRDNKLSRQYQSLRQVFNRDQAKYNIFREFNGEGDVSSRNVKARVPILLSDLFGLGKIDELDLRKTGDIRIEIELDINNISVDIIASLNVYNLETVTGTGASIKKLTLEEKVINLDDVPFWVGQKVEIVSGVKANPTGPSETLYSTISSIELVKGAGEMLDTVEIEFDYLVVSLAAAQTATPTIQAVGESFNGNDNSLSLSFDQVELVIHQMLDGTPRNEDVMYLTYDTENSNGNQNTRYQDQFILPPSCVNALICFRSTLGDDVLQSIDKDLTDYRARLDNINLTDRRVEFGKPFYYEQLVKVALNMDSDLKDLAPSTDASEDDIEEAENDNDRDFKIVPITCPITPSNKILQLSVNAGGAGVKNINVFKQIQKIL